MTEPDSRRLVILLGGRRVGVIVQGADGRLSLTYDDDWRRSANQVPLSLSMPLAGRDYPDPTVRSYLWGLLPDSERVLERWARDYQVFAIRSPCCGMWVRTAWA
jgi:serine/threonine-protein kinase HipA